MIGSTVRFLLVGSTPAQARQVRQTLDEAKIANPLVAIENMAALQQIDASTDLILIAPDLSSTHSTQLAAASMSAGLHALQIVAGHNGDLVARVPTVPAPPQVPLRRMSELLPELALMIVRRDAGEPRPSRDWVVAHW